MYRTVDLRIPVDSETIPNMSPTSLLPHKYARIVDDTSYLQFSCACLAWVCWCHCCRKRLVATQIGAKINALELYLAYAVCSSRPGTGGPSLDQSIKHLYLSICLDLWNCGSHISLNLLNRFDLPQPLLQSLPYYPQSSRGSMKVPSKVPGRLIA